jgi:hypothetical protein
MSPELIMWRVAVGRAWAESTTGVTYSANDARIGLRPVGHSTNIQLSQLNFKTQDMSATQTVSRSDGSFTKADEVA